MSEQAIAGSDSIPTSLVLAEAVNKIGGADLIVCGMASTDGSMTVAPAILAEGLGIARAFIG